MFCCGNNVPCCPGVCGRDAPVSFCLRFNASARSAQRSMLRSFDQRPQLKLKLPGTYRSGKSANDLGRVKTSRRNWPLEFFSCVRQIARADCGAIAWLYLRYSIQAPVCFPNSVPMNLIPGRPRKRILVVFRPSRFHAARTLLRQLRSAATNARAEVA